jgi:hypothetical protein
MKSIDPLVDVERVASEGLDHVFAHGSSAPDLLEEEQGEDDLSDSGAPGVDGLTLAQAATLLGFDQRSVKRLIKERKICGRRQGPNRNWIVDLDCVQTWLQKLGMGPDDQAATTAEVESGSHRLAVAAEIDENISVRTLWLKLDLAGQQLRAATYRVGYLESQVDLYRQQVALLPGYQADAARTTMAEQEVGDLQRQLSEAAAELERLRRPWWQRWFACSAQSPDKI